MILAVWTDDESQSALINPAVAHYTGQTELATAIQQGLKARERGDEAQATQLLGRAVQIAAASNPDTMKLCGRSSKCRTSGKARSSFAATWRRKTSSRWIPAPRRPHVCRDLSRNQPEHVYVSCKSRVLDARILLGVRLGDHR